MSLNGLEATEVNEAYQAALAEGGGWFLLKYVSRDEVGLLKKGTGGIQEVKETVSQYGEQSPLFGFANYRRRKVVLKYVPEGTSRLLQARLTVHFQAISEKLTPHDTVYSFSSPSDLRDHALSSACSLHTASTSIKSSNSSLRQRNLTEIAEDGEETPSVIEPNGLAGNGIWDGTTGERAPSSRERSSSSASGLEGSPVRSSRTFRDTMKALPPTPAKVEKTPEPVIDHSSQSEDVDVFMDSRPSSSTRPPTRDYYTGFDYKPKVKLGPRPSLEAGSTTQVSNHYRPVSSLPAGVKMPKRKPIIPHVDSQTLYTPSRHTFSSRGSTVIVPPPTPSSSTRIPDRPSTSQSNRTITRSSPADSKHSGMTPEKRRLMKAVQIRQKQLAAQAAAAANAEPSHSEVLVNDTSSPEEEHELRRPRTEIYSPMEVASGKDGDSYGFPSSEEARQDEQGCTGTDLANPEASPVSPHGTSDGVSTKPSSLSSENDSETPKTQERPSILSERLGDAPESTSQPGFEPSRDAMSKEPAKAMTTTNPNNLVIDDSTTPENVSSGPDLAVAVNHPADEDVKATVALFGSDLIRTAPDQIPLPPIDEKECLELERRPGSIVLPPEDDQQSLLTRPSRPSTADTDGLWTGEKLGKRKAPGSLKRVSSPDHSEEPFLSDDSFLEELKSATVQEAKPISVSKSPMNSMFPQTLSDLQEDVVRSVSMPQAYHERNPDVASVSGMPRLLSLRSASASQSPPNNLPQATPSLRKVGVSTGISQRIKALEKLSSRPTSPGTPLPSAVTPASATAFPAFSSRKNSPRSRPSTSETGQPLLSPPVIEKFFVIPQTSQTTDQGSSTTFGKSRPESIDSRSALNATSGDKNLTRTQQRSPDKSSTSNIFKKPALKRHTTSPSISSNPATDQRRSDTVTMTKRDSIISRLSSSANISRRGSEAEIPRSPSESSLLSGVTSLGGEDGKDVEKKESRKSRLLKRMSNLSSVSRKSIVSALNSPVKDRPIFENVESSQENANPKQPASIELGDVNIQFPDSLLWRRRNARIDKDSMLVLAPSKADNNSRAQIKQFPLSAFRAPYIPDLDAQELPHSVNLEFQDGSMLQCACESPGEQMQILRFLKRGWEKAVR